MLASVGNVTGYVSGKSSSAVALITIAPLTHAAGIVTTPVVLLYVKSLHATPPIVTVIVSGRIYPLAALRVAVYSVPAVTVVSPVVVILASVGKVTA